MPKKFKGENSKAVSAKERKATKAAETKEKVERAAEDARWQDDDKNSAKKNQRKEDREKKRLDEAQRKQENRLLAQQEEAAIQGITGKPAAAAAAAPKVTRFQVQQQRQQADAAAAAIAKAANSTPTPNALLVENTNKLEDVVSASGIDDAIKVLSLNGTSSEGGERVSMAAAFHAFEEQQMPRLKKENPTLKLSQLKQRLRKEWQRSPDNPINQAKLCS